VLVVGLVLAGLAPGASATEQGPSKKIVVLMPGQLGLPAAVAALGGFRSALRKADDFVVSTYVEHLDRPPLDGADGERRLRDGLRAKYAGVRLDGIAAFTPSAVGFLARWGGDLWPGVPGVAFGIDDRVVAGLALPPGVTTIPVRFDAAGTVRLALALLPETRRVALVGGASPLDAKVTEVFRADLGAFGDRLELIDLAGLPLEDLLARLAVLPDRTILLGSSFTGDGRGRPYFWADVAPAISAAAKRPTFAAVSTAMGTGIIGGSMVDLGEVGEEAGRTMARLLRGEAVAAMAASEVRPRVVADWQQLRRWHLDEARLPPGSRVLDREWTLWERFRWQVMAALGLLTGLSLAVLGLLLERGRRRRVQVALEERLRFELLLSEISAGFAQPLSAASIDEHVRDGLRRVAALLGAEGASLWQPSGSGQTASAILAWPERDGAPAPVSVSLDDFPFTWARTRRGETVRFRALDELPPEASVDRQSYARQGVRSLVAVPLEVDGQVTGVICCLTFRRGRAWSDDVVRSLRTVGEVFAAVVARARSEAALGRSEALNRGVLASLPSEVAVIDRDGVILYVNEQWVEFARGHGGEGNPMLGTGANYLEVCRRAAAMSDRGAARALAIIESVLSGGDDGQTLEYVCGTPGQEQWFDMHVRRLDADGSAAVVVHRDITDVKRATLETQRTLTEMAHLDRLAAVGELASALAHELNQPLTAILANAQAARRWLASDSSDLDEIRETLDDIIADDRRAGDVIRRIRALLKKEEIPAELIDVNEVVREVVRLIENDALLQSCSIALDLAPALPKLRGDRVQIQQVLLNLLMNGLQAVADLPLHRRRLVVRTASAEGGLEVTVQDGGEGIAEEDLPRVFEPFFTTKGEGLGIGLSISRSIVEAHGGRIWVENDPDGGGIFRVRLPAAPATADFAEAKP
jgi:signal transduction histidine kinase